MAYLFYDKSQVVSLLVLLVAIVIALVYVISEVYFKNKTIDAQAKETEANAKWKPMIGKYC